MAYYLTNKAKEDLLSIGRYTEKRWGRDQRNIYLRQLDSQFKALGQNPMLGKSCDDLINGYRKHSEGKHIIFYKQVENEIEIIRILHERMDHESHL